MRDSAVIDIELDITAYKKYLPYTSFLTVAESGLTDIDETQLLDYTSHGSECLRYFERGSRSCTNYFILLRAGEEGMCNIYDLIVALNWCIDNGVSLVSLSMGTMQYSDARLFRDVMRCITESGVCLIAGASNVRNLSYPACFSEAIGVCYDYTSESVKGRFASIDNPLDGIDVVLNPEIDGCETVESTSMATAYFSGLVAGAINSGKAEPSEIKKWIYSNAGTLQSCSLYDYTLNAIMYDATEDIIVVAIDGLATDNKVVEYCRELQEIFLSNEYYCLTIFPKNSIKPESNFYQHEFVQPLDDEYSYGDYIRIIMKLCKPNLIIASFDEHTDTGADVAICGKGRNSKHKDTLFIDYNSNSPTGAFEQIEKYFNSEG